MGALRYAGTLAIPLLLAACGREPQVQRSELVEAENAESKVIEAYLPEQLSEEDIKKTIDETIAAMGVSGPAAMGQVIGAVKGKLGTAADGGTIARLVKESLS